MVRLEELDTLKKNNKLIGLEPANFPLLAYRLNHITEIQFPQSLSQGHIQISPPPPFSPLNFCFSRDSFLQKFFTDFQFSPVELRLAGCGLLGAKLTNILSVSSH
jgi:hypothetical protein